MAAGKIKHIAGKNAPDQRYERPVPPFEVCGRMHQADRLSRKQDLEEPYTFAKGNTRQRAGESNQGSPKQKPDEIFVTEPDETQASKQREREAGEFPFRARRHHRRRLRVACSARPGAVTSVAGSTRRGCRRPGEPCPLQGITLALVHMPMLRIQRYLATFQT